MSDSEMDERSKVHEMRWNALEVDGIRRLWSWEKL